MKVLQYSKWQNFEKIIDKIIDKAKETCKNSNINVEEQFTDVSKLSKRANNAGVSIIDYKLTRYACYVIAQNGDSRKKVIALAQTYFAIQTRKQEIEVIAKNGGTMPEDLPTPKKSLKQLEKEKKNLLKK